MEDGATRVGPVVPGVFGGPWGGGEWGSGEYKLYRDYILGKCDDITKYIKGWEPLQSHTMLITIQCIQKTRFGSYTSKNHTYFGNRLEIIEKWSFGTLLLFALTVLPAKPRNGNPRKVVEISMVR